MDNVIQDTLCCVCGSPGMTQCETGRWLCERHSPYTSSDKEPQFDTYLKQKGIELALLFRGLVDTINQLADNPTDRTLLDKAVELSKLKTLYHPMSFFMMLDKLEPALKQQFLQDKNIFSFPSIYEPDEYLGIDSITTKARFWCKMIGNTTSITSLKLETVMNLPGRIGYKHDDRFKGLPLLPAPVVTVGIPPVPCGNCEQHGNWNIWMPCGNDRHLVNRCKQCNGTGWCHSTDKIQPEEKKTWLFVPSEQKYTWANARRSEQLGAEVRAARVHSKLSPAEFSRRISDFIGETVSPSTLMGIENGTAPLYDVIYVAAGEVANVLLNSFRKK